MSNDSKSRFQPAAKIDLKGGEGKYDHIQPVYAEPLEVKVYDNFDKALKAFRAIVQKERVLSTYKERQSYEKPSVKHRRKRAEARRKAFEAEQKDNRRRKQPNDRFNP